MVVYHGTMREKMPEKHIQVQKCFSNYYPAKAYQKQETRIYNICLSEVLENKSASPSFSAWKICPFSAPERGFRLDSA